MNKNEIVQIGKLIAAAYPNQTFDKDKLSVWYELLNSHDYETIRANTIQHIKRSEYAPTIADLIRLPKETGTPLRNAARVNLDDVKKAEDDATEFLRQMGELE